MTDDVAACIAQLWHRNVQALGPAGQTLRPRPGRVDLQPIEDGLGLRLPNDYRAWLALHDGEDDVPGRVEYLPGGGFLLPADVTLQRWLDNREWFQADDDTGPVSFQDDDRIRNVVFHARRVMIASNRYGDGDNTFLDFCPGPAGTAGQVIVATSECDFEVVGASFEDFLRRLATALEEGLLVVLPAQRGAGPRVARAFGNYPGPAKAGPARDGARRGSVVRAANRRSKARGAVPAAPTATTATQGSSARTRVLFGRGPSALPLDREAGAALAVPTAQGDRGVGAGNESRAAIQLDRVHDAGGQQIALDVGGRLVVRQRDVDLSGGVGSRAAPTWPAPALIHPRRTPRRPDRGDGQVASIRKPALFFLPVRLLLPRPQGARPPTLPCGFAAEPEELSPARAGVQAPALSGGTATAGARSRGRDATSRVTSSGASIWRPMSPPRAAERVMVVA